MIERGMVCWQEAHGAVRRYPVVVVQSDPFNRSLLPSILVVPLVDQARLADAPGNVLVPATETGLPQAMVAEVTRLHAADRHALAPGAGRLSGARLEAVNEGLRLVLGLPDRRRPAR